MTYYQGKPVHLDPTMALDCIDYRQDIYFMHPTTAASIEAQGSGKL